MKKLILAGAAAFVITGPTRADSDVKMKDAIDGVAYAIANATVIERHCGQKILLETFMTIFPTPDDARVFARDNEAAIAKYVDRFSSAYARNPRIYCGSAWMLKDALRGARQDEGRR